MNTKASFRAGGIWYNCGGRWDIENVVYLIEQKYFDTLELIKLQHSNGDIENIIYIDSSFNL